MLLKNKILGDIYQIFSYASDKTKLKSFITLFFVFLAGILESIIVILVIPFSKEIFNQSKQSDIIFLKKISILLAF